MANLDFLLEEDRELVMRGHPIPFENCEYLVIADKERVVPTLRGHRFFKGLVEHFHLDKNYGKVNCIDDLYYLYAAVSKVQLASVLAQDHCGSEPAPRGWLGVYLNGGTPSEVLDALTQTERCVSAGQNVQPFIKKVRH